MAILSTYKNELGIALCLSAKWPKEQRERLILEAKAMKAEREQKERLLRELKAANQESSGGKSGIIELDKGE